MRYQSDLNAAEASCQQKTKRDMANKELPSVCCPLRNSDFLMLVSAFAEFGFLCDPAVGGISIRAVIGAKSSALVAPRAGSDQR